MDKKKDLKQKIVNQLLEIINEKIENAQSSIDSAKESRDNETKSSVGDKYETGRAMMQFEIEKNKVQLNKALQLKNELSKIDLNKKCKIVEFGSLVLTNQENYFVSIGLGKIEVDKEAFFTISIASPVGKTLYHKKTSEKIIFQGKEIIITEII